MRDEFARLGGWISMPYLVTSLSYRILDISLVPDLIAITDTELKYISSLKLWKIEKGSPL